MSNASYSINDLRQAVKQSQTFKQVAEYLGLRPASNTRITLKRKAIANSIDFSHFKYQDEVWQKEPLVKAVHQSECLTDVLRFLGRSTRGNNFTTLKKYLARYQIDYTHFKKNPQRTGKFRCTQQSFAKGVEWSPATLKKHYLRQRTKIIKCDRCGQEPNWFGCELVLQLDHIDGDRLNNQLSNLRLLCPNCHSQTSTWGSRNK